MNAWLYSAAPAADHPYPAVHSAGQLFHRPGRSGWACGAGHRSPARDRRCHRGRRCQRVRRGRSLQSVPRAGPGFDQADRTSIRFRQTAARTSLADAEELRPTGFRQQFLSRRYGDRPHSAENAGVDIAGALGDVADLPGVDPAGDSQSSQTRQPVRYLEQHRHHHRLRHASLPVRHAAGGGVLWRHVAELVSGARTGLGQLRATDHDRQDR
ncbi:hypothetical protein PssB301D_05219 [Pseudomonas syringae pv. syringae str. B301D-R]|nr:hypothetical protein PssB301D_05219 [Pseudomonas syringae pv. syringae str. B301D-R]